MKKFIASLLLVSGLSLTSFGATYLDVYLTWTGNFSETNLVSNYVVYCARDGGTNFVPTVTVPASTNATKARVQITPGVTKKLTFKVTAKNVIGESIPSNPVDVPQANPTGPIQLNVLKTEVYIPQE